MRKLFRTLIVLITCLAASQAQVYPDRHTTNGFDGWISCDKSTNPNPAHGNSHWILYDFSQNYSLFDMTIWNMNHPDYIDDGLKNVIIEYSTNGSGWTLLDTVTFPKAPGSGFYEGFTGPDLGGVSARYLLLTAINNHGGGCYGLSEIRIYTQDQTNPDLNFTFTLCENDGVYSNLTGGWDFGGTYSGWGVTDNGNETFNFDAGQAGPGAHLVEYMHSGGTLEGEITVLPCDDPICPECPECDVQEVLALDNTPIPPDVYHAYQVSSTGMVDNNTDVTFLANNSIELNPGFQVNSQSIFLADFRYCDMNSLQNGDFEIGQNPWGLSNHSGAQASWSLDGSEPYAGSNSARISVTNATGTFWHVQFYQGGQSMEAGKEYRISFAARAAGGGAMSLIAQLGASPWTVYASKNFTLTNNWETYNLTFTAGSTVSGNLNIMAQFGLEENEYWIDNIKYVQKN